VSENKTNFYISLINVFALNSFDPNPTTRHTVFSVVIGGFFYWASLLCVNQSAVQKAMSLRSLSKAKIALTLSILGLAAVFLMNFYTGLAAFAKYENCDPFKSGKIAAIDQLVPFYVMEQFGRFPSFVGIFVAGIFAASLGTVAACLSSLSAVTIEDLLISGINMKLTPEKSMRYAKWMNFGYGIASFALIFLVEGRSVLQATLTLNGLIGGILLGLFSLGIFFKKANLKGALYGGVLAVGVVMTLGIFALTYGTEEPFLKSSVEGCSCTFNATNTLPPAIDSNDAWYTSIYKVSYMWYSMIGCFLTIIFGLTISIITQAIDDYKVSKFSQPSQDHQNYLGRFTTNSFTASGRKVSSIIQTVTHDVLKIENKLREVISHPHTAQDEINICNQETIQVGQPENFTDTSIFGIFENCKKEHDGVDNPSYDNEKSPTKV
jgi:solute carrier family 5 (sodium-coupled monocarboxylate transporter), member 8/12